MSTVPFIILVKIAIVASLAATFKGFLPAFLRGKYNFSRTSFILNLCNAVHVVVTLFLPRFISTSGRISSKCPVIFHDILVFRLAKYGHESEV